jgi:3-hydroxybutyryl-CoA dehydratase
MLKQPFEDIVVGAEVTTHAITVTESHVTQFSWLTGDQAWLHTDAVASANGPFGQRIAHGLLVLSLAGGLMYQHSSSWALANYGYDRIRFTAPVFFGDTIHLRITCTAKEREKGDRGVVVLGLEMRNQDDEVVLVADQKVLVGKRASAQ